MKVRLDQIPAGGLPVSFEAPGVGPEQLGPQVARVTRAPRVELTLDRQGGLVRARGRFQVGLEVICSRCLAQMELDLTGPIEILFAPQSLGQGDPAEEIGLSEEDMDVVFYDGDELDLGQTLAGEIGLAVPMAPVCRDGCQGICPHCGKPLAGGRCSCRDRETDPRWAKLAQLKKS